MTDSTSTPDSKSPAKEPPAGRAATPRLILMNVEPHLRSTIEQLLRREGLVIDVIAGGYEAALPFMSHETVKKGRLTLRLSERRAFFDNREIEKLTPKEYALLHELVHVAPRVVDRSNLVMKVWGSTLQQIGRKTLDVHIQRLRRKLGPAASTHLKTVSLVGYQWLDALTL